MRARVDEHVFLSDEDRCSCALVANLVARSCMRYAQGLTYKRISIACTYSSETSFLIFTDHEMRCPLSSCNWKLSKLTCAYIDDFTSIEIVILEEFALQNKSLAQ